MNEKKISVYIKARLEDKNRNMEFDTLHGLKEDVESKFNVKVDFIDFVDFVNCVLNPELRSM